MSKHDKQEMIVRHKLFDRICHWFIVAVGLVTFLTGFPSSIRLFNGLGR